MTHLVTRLSAPHRRTASERLLREAATEVGENGSSYQAILALRGETILRAFADLIAKRATLHWLAQCHPYWTHQELADTLGMSRSWVSKWRKLLRQADVGDVMAFHSRSRARHTPPASIASQTAVVQRILEIRTAAPENLHRVPGPETILDSLHRDPTLTRADLRLPHSQTPIWKILRQFGCLQDDRRRKSKPLELRQPGEEVQFDLKDASSVPADPRSANGSMSWRWLTSLTQGPPSGCIEKSGLLLMRRRGTEAVAQFLREHGLPAMLTLVGSSRGRDFPSALVRFLWCVGVTQSAHPPASTRFERLC
jgi:hypothetical protein